MPQSLLSVAGMLQLRYMWWLARIYSVFTFVAVNFNMNQMIVYVVLLCVLGHTIITSPTCALAQCFFPNNHVAHGVINKYIAWILTWAPQFVNATIPEPVSGSGARLRCIMLSGLCMQRSHKPVMDYRETLSYCFYFWCWEPLLWIPSDASR